MVETLNCHFLALQFLDGMCYFLCALLHKLLAEYLNDTLSQLCLE